MNKFFYQILALLLLCSSSAYAQELRIRGNVINSEDKQAVIGAAVSIKGTNSGTLTDVDGNFEINVPKTGTVLQVSFIGMDTKYVTVESSQHLNIVLNTDSKMLKDVVVTALGIKRSEKALGYATQAVSGEALQKVKGVELATSLSGKVAGLIVKNSSDFAVTPEFTIRGEKPLLVIDGIPYENKTLSDMSSEDIASMSILKGATASALYGNRGASGAILITTKNGSNNKQGLTLEISSNTMFSAGFLAIPEKQNIYGRGTANVYDKHSSNSWGPKMEGQSLEQWDPFLKEYRSYAYLPVGKNNFKNFLQQGFVTNNNVNLGYKNDVSAIRSSINWTQNHGQYPNQTLDKFTYSLGGDINLGKLKLSSNMAYSKRKSPNMGSNGYTSYDPMYTLLINSGSDFNILDYKNNYWLKKDESQNFTYQKDNNNPYFDAYEKTNETSRDIFNADLSVSYDLTDWMKITARSGLDFFTDRGVQRISRGSYVSTGNTPIPGNQWTWNGTTTGGYNVGQTQGFSMNNDLLLTGERSFGNFTVEYLGGGTISYNRNNTIFAMTQGGISIPGYFSLKASVNPVKAEENVRSNQVNSLYGRAAFSWNRMIFAEVTGRNDWNSSMSTTPNPSYFYPSIASSFVVSELMPQTKDWLDMLKLRGSWTMSKKPADIYATNSVYSVNSAAWGAMNGASASSFLYSNDLKPQKDVTFEFGLQGMVFKNRLMLDVSYYEKKTSDILKEGILSEATGYTKKFINTNEIVTRKGWEIVLNGTPLKTADWQLDIAFNWSTYATYWTQLDENFTPKNPWTKVGERTDPHVSRDFMYDSQGNMIIENGSPVSSAYDTNFGWKDPNFVWGVNTTLQYKNFSLYASFDGVVGGMMSTRTESYMWQNGVHPKTATDARLNPYIAPGVKIVSGSATFDQFGNITGDDRVFAPNDIATTYQDYINRIHGSSAWGGNGTRADIYSRTYFKFRELSLTYNIPQSLLAKCKIKGASVAFVGQNIMLWSKDFKYSDPDGGFEDFADPSVRYLGGNIKLTF